jgi:diguanylate cyclase (GGDEF)-like protein
MSAAALPAFDPWRKDRLVLVAPEAVDDGLARTVGERYPDWRVSTCDTYLSGVAELAQSGARAVVACVDPRLRQSSEAVAGLRLAAGKDARLVLCCTPETEAMARRLLSSGADDYVLHPLRTDELDAALGYSRPGAAEAPSTVSPPSATMDELAQLAEVLAHLADDPSNVLKRVAALVRSALGAKGARVIVQGSVAEAGESSRQPVLSAALVGVAGSLSLSEREDGVFTTADANKLEHYARVIGHVLQAAARQRHWRTLALTDDCSGLPNRRYLHERLDAILTLAANQRQPATLLLFDIDDFKTYNDEHGHHVGDEILRRVGALFRKHCREHDVVTRYGGDEFAVVFWDPHGPRVPGSKHPDCALSVLQRIREALRAESIEGPESAGPGRLTISGGLATYPWDAIDAATLLSRADEALLAAKRAGKNRILLIGEQGSEQARADE